MIQSVTLTQFKRFSNSTFRLHTKGISFLAGGNNSGKSTLLQALAVWEFCRVVLEMERGRASLCTGYSGQGLGLSDDEFSPVAVASLKHLWTNLKTQAAGAQNGYTLEVACSWLTTTNVPKHLSIALALANDRLFIKAGSTNLQPSDAVPEIAYLPPFAGISNRENLMSGAERRAMIGKGLAGGVIRNVLHDMYKENEEARARLKSGRSKIKTKDLENLRSVDPWEILQRTLAVVFQAQLEVSPFNSLYHSSIKVSVVKGRLEKTKFIRHPNYRPRDLMAEGSGFLQWLSVYALALSPSVQTLLLDEPDAHLHPTLQTQLVENLDEIAASAGKQVLLATHSTEILRWADHANILAFKGCGAKYLQQSEQKVSLFVGLGSDYAPKLDPLRSKRRMLVVENLSDERLLRIWANALSIVWPSNLVSWPWTGSSIERKQLFLQLQAEIPELKAISLRDRDDLQLNQVDSATLEDKSVSTPHQHLSLRVWRRRHIENYLLHPAAIARAAGCDVSEVHDLMREHALVVPDDFTSRTVANAMIDARGKEITQGGGRSIKNVFSIEPEEIARAMTDTEVAEDVRELIRQIVSICSPPETS